MQALQFPKYKMRVSLAISLTWFLLACNKNLTDNAELGDLDKAISSQTSSEIPLIKRFCPPKYNCDVPFVFAITRPELLLDQTISIYGYISSPKQGFGVYLYESDHLFAGPRQQPAVLLVPANREKLMDFPNKSWVMVSGKLAISEQPYAAPWLEFKVEAITRIQYNHKSSPVRGDGEDK